MNNQQTNIMSTFKELHAEWKKNKDSLKSSYGIWERINADLSNAHEEVKSPVKKKLPKFDQKLGPSLDTLDKNPNDAKAKKTASKAITVYEKGIKDAWKDADGITLDKDKKYGGFTMKQIKDALEEDKKAAFKTLSEISDKL